MIVQFYNAYQMRRVPCGVRRFVVKRVGHKWVQLKESNSPRWTRIKRKVWNEIMECPTFKIIQE